ncbi:5-dehydro-4-deoxy-D-glucuronate isomerase [Oricola sp.]|uniref:5-dehydro-4-deoxy-D-glucuronate isomerase n=1 Tax=Oricola sp. TaxID=1979950 RepID=UPI0025D358DE|nr:5-dehydro-4-deoxy-D-glucuronate isomerase [Oricola sp.]MCI5076104.1 5-dehydro-4-deoxy-D-glucuronate isomerase [Oricola sp.]
MSISIRQAVSPAEARGFDTDALRRNFLVTDLFSAREVRMTYSHVDRTVIGGALPGAEPLDLAAPTDWMVPSFTARREMGVFNIGGAGGVILDRETIALPAGDCLYVPMGVETIAFYSDDPTANPAKFYFVSTPAHARHDVRVIARDEANVVEIGEDAQANKRTLRQYIHPAICASCQLLMGMTTIAEGSVWNTMPCHTHDRRSEAYLYFDMAPDARVFHFMGEPEETRHLVVANEQAIISPGWSIHCGAGTSNYGFIWSMAGDNQEFTDMDMVAMETLR